MTNRLINLKTTDGGTPLEHLKELLLDVADHLSAVPNYIVPGLRSTLLRRGRFRLFEATRPPELYVTPHTHRYDFACCVVAGAVRETVLRPVDNPAVVEAQQYVRSSYRPGEIPPYVEVVGEWYSRHEERHLPGEWYGLRSDQFHTVEFAAGTVVLFLEGPELNDFCYILEPYVNGQHLQTFQVQPWMQAELKP